MERLHKSAIKYSLRLQVTEWNKIVTSGKLNKNPLDILQASTSKLANRSVIKFVVSTLHEIEARVKVYD